MKKTFMYMYKDILNISHVCPVDTKYRFIWATLSEIPIYQFKNQIMFNI
jgi:hypothetical protein